MEEKSPTICTKCKHVRETDKTPPYWKCGVTATEHLNYQTGDMDIKMSYCEGRNSGNCPDYEEADGD